MFDTLISSKTRIKLLIRFFLNPEQTAYLRGLEREFDDSTNSIRLELNRFESAGLISAGKEGNRKVYRVNPKYPLYGEIRSMALKHFGIDRILDQVTERLGGLQAVYLTGQLAKGIDSRLVDIALVGSDINRAYLSTLVQKAEKIINRNIRTLVVHPENLEAIPEPRVLIYGVEG